jgi:hypothetical protein
MIIVKTNIDSSDKRESNLKPRPAHIILCADKVHKASDVCIIPEYLKSQDKVLTNETVSQNTMWFLAQDYLANGK